MRARRLSLLALLGVLGFAGMLAGTPPWISAQESEKTKAELAALDKKLKDVIATQRTILEKLNAIVEELQVVKVRCTN